MALQTRAHLRVKTDEHTQQGLHRARIVMSEVQIQAQRLLADRFQ